MDDLFKMTFLKQIRFVHETSFGFISQGLIIISGLTLCMLANWNAFFHLCYCWNAGI